MIEQRKAFFEVSEEIRKTSYFSNEVTHVLQDGPLANSKPMLPTDPLRFEDICEQDLGVTGFKARNLIPLPTEIGVSDEEVNRDKGRRVGCTQRYLIA